MAKEVRAIWSARNINGVIDTLVLYQEGFSGDSLTFDIANGFDFQHQEITKENDGYLTVHENKIMMGVLNFYPLIDTEEKRTLLEEIADSKPTDFLIRWSRDGQIKWYGYPSGKIITYEEDNSFFATCQFRDFEIAKGIDYELSDTRVTAITAFAALFKQLDFFIPNSPGLYLGIKTNTSWTETNLNANDDFLNQVFVDTYSLRNFKRNGDEPDTKINVFDALKRLGSPALLISQMDGKFVLRQLSDYQDPTNVLECEYDHNGVQLSSSFVDSTVTAYTDANVGTPSLKTTSVNTSYPALSQVGVEFDHRSLQTGIDIPRSVKIEKTGEQSYSTPIVASRDEFLIISGKSRARMVDPWKSFTVFNTGDVNVGSNTISIPSSLSNNSKIRFINDQGGLPAPFQENVTYWVEYIDGNRIGVRDVSGGNTIDITSAGAGRMLILDTITIPTTEYGITFGEYFFDAGFGDFVLPGDLNATLSSWILDGTDIDTTYDLFNQIGHGFKDGQVLRFKPVGASTLPANISESTNYYVVNRTTSSFQISEEYEGTPIDLTGLGTGSWYVQRIVNILSLTQGLIPQGYKEYNSSIAFEVPTLPNGVSGDVTVHLLPGRVLEQDYNVNGYFDETYWEDFTVQVQDASSSFGTSIEYELTQNDAYPTTYQTESIWFGDGPYTYSRSALRFSTNTEDVTANWQIRGEVTTRSFGETLLKEILNHQRTRTKKINAVITGEYDWNSVLLYRGMNLIYAGGKYKDGIWRPVLMELNWQDAGDTFTEVVRTDPTGASGTIISNPTSDTTTDGDAENTYLTKALNLSDLSSISATQQNLALVPGQDVQEWDPQLDTVAGLTDTQAGYLTSSDQPTNQAYSPTFAGATFNGSITVNGDIIRQGQIIQIDAELTTTDAVLGMNAGEVGLGVTLGYSGLDIDRGSQNNFWFGFDEVRDMFTVGEISSLSALQIATTQVVATIQDSPNNGGIPYYDSTDFQLKTSSAATLDSGGNAALNSLLTHTITGESGALSINGIATLNGRLDVVGSSYGQGSGARIRNTAGTATNFELAIHAQSTLGIYDVILSSTPIATFSFNNGVFISKTFEVLDSSFFRKGISIYNQNAGFTDERLTFNQLSGNFPRIYNYDEVALNYGSINIGGINNETTGTTWDASGNFTQHGAATIIGLITGSDGLHINDDDADVITANTTQSQNQWNYQMSGTDIWGLIATSTQWGVYDWINANWPLRIGASTVDISRVVVIDTGTTGTNTSFDMSGTQSIDVGSTSTEGYIDFRNFTTMALRRQGTNILDVNFASGNIGLNGTTTVSGVLSVNSDTTNGGIQLTSTDTGAFLYPQDDTTTAIGYVGFGAVGNQARIIGSNVLLAKYGSTGITHLADTTIDAGLAVNQLLTVVNDIYPSVSYGSNLGSPAKKFLTAHIAELRVETLVADERRSTIGGRLNVGLGNILTRAIGTTETTIYVRANNLNLGDKIHLEADLNVEIMEVTSTYTTITAGEEYSYTVTRNLDGTGANSWVEGSGIINTGTVGTGFIDIYATNSLKTGVQTAGSTIAFMQRTGTGAFDLGIRAATGNMKGWYGYTTDTYGAGFGDESGENLTIDPTNGLRIRAASNILMQANSGVLTVGTEFSYTASTSTFLFVGWTAQNGKLYNGTDIELDATNKRIALNNGEMLYGYEAGGTGKHGLRLGISDYWYSDKTGSLGGGIINWTASQVIAAGAYLDSVAMWGGNATKSMASFVVDWSTQELLLGAGTYASSDIAFDAANNSFKLGGTNGITWSGSGDVQIGTGVTISGTLNGADGTFSGVLSAATGTFAGSLTAATGTFSGDLSAAGGTFSGSLSAATGTFAGSLSAATGSFSGTITSSAGSIGGFTLSSTSLTGPFGVTIGQTAGSNAPNHDRKIGIQIDGNNYWNYVDGWLTATDYIEFRVGGSEGIDFNSSTGLINFGDNVRVDGSMVFTSTGSLTNSTGDFTIDSDGINLDLDTSGFGGAGKEISWGTGGEISIRTQALTTNAAIWLRVADSSETASLVLGSGGPQGDGYFEISGFIGSHQLMFNSGGFEISGAPLRLNNDIEYLTGETAIGLNSNGSIELYHDNSKKLETTSVGVTVTGSLTETSDARLKTNLIPLDNAIAKLRQITPYSYNWIEDERSDFGYSAQEVHQVLPEIAKHNAENDSWGLTQSRLIPFVHQAVIEHDDEINMLKTRVSELEKLLEQNGISYN